MLVAMNAAFACPPRHYRVVSFCCGSHQLREQLDSLYQESEKTRTRANNTRLRLMRLSEAAEKLRRQATLEVQAGNENAARDLLQQKKKVMEALEKSKNRIELLDELSTKVNEAISMKETQLISNVAKDGDVEKEDPAASIWSISPKEEVLQESNEHGESNSNSVMPEDAEKYELESNSQTLMGVYDEKIYGGRLQNNLEVDERDNSSEIMSSYEKFLDHIDGQLINLESQIVTFLRLTTAIMEEEEKIKNLKVKTVLELLTAVRNTRERLANALEVRREGR
ncbi:hypothetical protein EJ110_NYTH14189 [Nymphaea thermarum]|nr:hypothetical protein EJ110_NYTH14189 [Nymphaea thermarum]